jgi:hypothetical protein
MSRGLFAGLHGSAQMLPAPAFLESPSASLTRPVRVLELFVPREHGTEPETACVVHIEDTHGRTAHGSQAHNGHAGQHEVVLPDMHPGVEQRDNAPRVGVNPREICALMGIAPVTG